MKKKDPVIEKLDEILKELKRIEAKPPVVVTQPFTYYPPVYVYPQTANPYIPTYPFTITCDSKTTAGSTYLVTTDGSC